MAKAKKAAGSSKKKPIEQYAHTGKRRANNPPVGLVTPATDKESGKKTYAYDPHLDHEIVDDRGIESLKLLDLPG